MALHEVGPWLAALFTAGTALNVALIIVSRHRQVYAFLLITGLVLSVALCSPLFPVPLMIVGLWIVGAYVSEVVGWVGWRLRVAAARFKPHDDLSEVW